MKDVIARVPGSDRSHRSWTELIAGCDAHPEDVFLARWSRQLSQPRSSCGRALALAALDQVDGVDGPWHALSLCRLIDALPGKDRGLARALLKSFVAWLTVEGLLDEVSGQRLAREAAPQPQTQDERRAAA